MGHCCPGAAQYPPDLYPDNSSHTSTIAATTNQQEEKCDNPASADCNPAQDTALTPSEGGELTPASTSGLRAETRDRNEFCPVVRQ